jgi:hypothetical protein
VICAFHFSENVIRRTSAKRKESRLGAATAPGMASLRLFADFGRFLAKFGAHPGQEFDSVSERLCGGRSGNLPLFLDSGGSAKTIVPNITTLWLGRFSRKNADSALSFTG